MNKEKIIILVILGVIAITYVLSIVFGISGSVIKCIEETINIAS